MNRGCPAVDVTSMGTSALVFPQIQTLSWVGPGVLAVGFPVSGLQSGPTPSFEARLSVKAGSGWGNFPIELKELFSKVHWRLVKCST